MSAALDGELSPAEWAKLSGHLMECKSCRALAEDLRALTDALEDSDREPPAGLAESVRRAVAEGPQAVHAPKKRRPPYLQSLAAMLALCVGLGAIGLFAAGQGGGGAGSADYGAAPALYQAPQASQAAPEAMEKSAAGCDGTAEDNNGTARYSATEGGDPTEASMEESDAEAPQLAPADAPMPSSAPAPQAAGTYNYSGGTEEVTPDSGSDGAGPTSDSIGGEEKPALTPGEAVSTPEEAEELAREFYASSGEKPDLWTFTWLGLSPNGRYYLFEVCQADSGEYRTMLAVPLEGGQVLDEQDAEYHSAVEQ